MNSASSDQVTRLFRTIDQREWDQLPQFFHQNVVYERPGHDRVSGLDALLRFYREERKIKSGRHDVETIVADENHTVAIGTFRGELRDGTSADEMFADVCTFKDGQIWRRRTFFFRPAI
jgi:ketosteroid isomerase-like protein